MPFIQTVLAFIVFKLKICYYMRAYFYYLAESKFIYNSKLLKVGLNILMFKENFYGLHLEKFKTISFFMRKNLEINFS